MILFDLINQTISGKNAASITEVRWSGDECVVNGSKKGAVKTEVINAPSLEEAERAALLKASHLISTGGADLFALLNITRPFKIGKNFRCQVVYSNVKL